MSKSTSTEDERKRKLKEYNILLQPQFADFSKITDSLFLTGVGGMTAPNFRKNGITFIVNVTQEAPNLRLRGVECTRVPLDDSLEENIIIHLDGTVDKINDVISKGGKVVVHCVAGVSRSAAIVIAYLMKHQGMNLHDAFNHVSRARRVIRPNNSFIKQLITYEKQIFRKVSVHMTTLNKDDVTIEIPDFFVTEHKRFVLLEAFKAKAKQLKQESNTSTCSKNTS